MAAHPSRKPHTSRSADGNIKPTISRLPDLVLRRIFDHLEAPSPIKKPRSEHLGQFFENHRIVESDPRDLLNLTRTCRDLYQVYRRVSRCNHIFDRFYIEVPGPPVQEPRLVRIPGPGKLQTFIANPARRPTSEPLHQRSPQPAWIMRSDTTGQDGRIQKLDDLRDALVDIISKNCEKWVSTFADWPVYPYGELLRIYDPETLQLVNIRRNFLGVLNLHQFESSADQVYGPARFWAVICHCRTNKFLVLNSFGGSLWDRAIACPRNAQVVDSYSDARRIYEHGLASSYFDIEDRYHSRIVG